MLRRWYFSTSERHPRGQQRIAAEPLELEAASESPSPELCFRTTPAAFPKYSAWLPPPPPTLWGGAHAGVSYKKLFVMNNSKHIQSKQKCIMNLQVLTGQLPQLSVFTHSHNIYTSTHSPNRMVRLTHAFSLGMSSVSSERGRDLPQGTQSGGSRAGATC